jgi:hypothetical protein
MRCCPRCSDDDGRPREIPISVTRWTHTGIETVLRCPHCGWHDVYVDSGSMTTASAVERPDPPTREEGTYEAA